VSTSNDRGPAGPKLPSHHPPPALEERVVASLARRGLLSNALNNEYRRRPWRLAAAIAASIVLFVVGAVSERIRSAREPEADLRPRYALLLYGGSAADSASERAQVDEYRLWARGIAQHGHYVSGEKLADQARELTAAGVAATPAHDSAALAGFFIVSAATEAEAESIAQSCPHLRAGGRIVVRRIEPT
jgi:hypothetical protein